MDWELEAGVTGLDVARAIKEETTSSPRMVIVSGNERAATLSDAERAEMLGAVFGLMSEGQRQDMRDKLSKTTINLNGKAVG